MKKKILKKIVLLVISTLAFNFVGCSKNDKDVMDAEYEEK